MFRTHTANSAANSPLLASSPVVASHIKELPRSSPAPRPQIPRGRQNSAHNEIAKVRPASTASNKPTVTANGSNVAKTPDLQQVAVITGKSAAEVKTTMKESTAKNGDRLFEEDSKPAAKETAEVNVLKGGVLLERSSSKASHTEKLKREADDSSEGTRGRKGSSAAPSPRLPPSSLANIEPLPARPDRRRAASSKTSTPVVSTFEEATASKPNGNRPPSRPSRQNTLTSNTSSSDATSTTAPQPIKRSHKKGAGLAAQAAAAAAAKAAAEKTRAGDEEEAEEDGGDEEGGENEPRYCYCNQVSYGEMIACDADDCPREWFHLECAGLDQIPGRNGKHLLCFPLSVLSSSNQLTCLTAKWYCNECKERLKKGKAFQGVVR